MRYYFDHAAATPVAQEVLHAMERFWVSDYGNPSAIHKEGLVAKKALDDARETIASLMNARAEGATFTSSATESIHLALTGAVRAWKRMHPGLVPEIIVSEIEHDAVLESATQLGSEGVVVHKLPVFETGIVDTRTLAPLLSERTVIVSCMLVNNEVGTVQPVPELARIIRKWKKDAQGLSRDKAPESIDMYPLLHTDATQAVNYYELDIPRLGVDMLSCNASKIYGPKGVGMLYRHPLALIDPVIVGGGQESGLRAGTEPVALIAGFARAFEIAQNSAVTESARLVPLRDRLFDNIIKVANELNVEVFENGDRELRAPNNVHVSFKNIDHEYLTILLDDAGFAVSTKSACNMLEAEVSHVLVAMKAGAENNICQLETGLRITLGRSTTEESCDALLATLRDVLPLAVIQ